MHKLGNFLCSTIFFHNIWICSCGVYKKTNNNGFLKNCYKYNRINSIKRINGIIEINYTIVE
jgi:hypothetical protein